MISIVRHPGSLAPRSRSGQVTILSFVIISLFDHPIVLSSDRLIIRRYAAVCWDQKRVLVPVGTGRSKRGGSHPQIDHQRVIDWCNACPPPPLHSTFSHHRQGRVDFNTVNPSLSTGKDFLIQPMATSVCPCPPLYSTSPLPSYYLHPHQHGGDLPPKTSKKLSWGRIL